MLLLKQLKDEVTTVIDTVCGLVSTGITIYNVGLVILMCNRPSTLFKLTKVCLRSSKEILYISKYSGILSNESSYEC
jgi:hypothetical protein